VIRPTPTALLAVPVLAVSCGAAQAAAMRCDGGVVRLGDTEATVLARCGEPDLASERQRELRGAHGRGVRLQDVKTWTYKRGYGRFVLILTFEGGLMTRIDRGPRQEELR
jgi:hypothetical protein